jgi:hypothetical protein
MRHLTKLSATSVLLKKAASLASSPTFPAWIDATEYGVPTSVMPRVRESLVLRLVAGRRQGRARDLIHATGAH